MADIKSELPIRSQLPGQTNYDDVIVKIGDGTSPTTQLLGIDSSGRVTIKLDDGAGNVVTSQANGAQRALDVGINVSGVQIDPRLAGQFNTVLPTVTSGSFTAPQTDSSGRLMVVSPTAANFLATVTQGTSPWITKDQADGSASGGTAGLFSLLMGGIFNTALPTLTTGQQASLQLDSSGRLIVDLGTSIPAGSNTIGNVGVTNLPTTVDTNYGAVGSSTIRVASQIGNATGAANFGNGATGAQTLRVAANLAVAGADVSGTNPVPVTITSALVGTSVNNYNTAAALAAAASSNHIYTITTGKTFNGKKIHASASGRMKVEVRTSPDGTTYSSLFVAFNSTANPNIDIDMDELVFLASGVGSTIEIIRTNIDLLAQDVYSTISGTEV